MAMMPFVQEKNSLRIAMMPMRRLISFEKPYKGILGTITSYTSYH